MKYTEPLGGAANDPYVDGDEGTGTEGSIVPAAAIEDPQREIDNAITQAGLTPSASDLTQLYEAMRQVNRVPLGALDYPTIDTANNTLTVTPAAATNGGTVAIPADVLISLAEEITSGETGILRNVKTAAFTSADLDISSTYYLRAKFVAGAWTVYTTKGADTDSIPAGLLGTVDGASGGGFDCTVLDMLIAKVVTGTATTVPTVTALANNKDLEVVSSTSVDLTTSLSWATEASSALTINWSRKPAVALIDHTFIAAQSSKPDGTSVAHDLRMIGLRLVSSSLSRYTTGDFQYVYDDSTGTGSSLDIQHYLRA